MTKKGFLLIVALVVLLAGALYITPALAAGSYQAENAVVGCGAVVSNNYAGYLGTGFVNFNWSGGYVEFRNVDGGAGGSGTLKLRYALGSTSSRSGRLTVNGANQNITFNPTGAWTTWTIKEVAVMLSPGTSNTIRLASTGQDLANLDQMEVQVTPVCEQPAPIYAAISISPTSLQVAGTFSVSLTTTLTNPTITLYEGDNVIATCSGNCGSGLTVVNGSPLVQFVTVTNPFTFTLKAIAAGTANIRATVQGTDVIYQYDPAAGVCRPTPGPLVSAQSQIVPVTLRQPLCGDPVPYGAHLSADPTALEVGETTQINMNFTNLGEQIYTLYANGKIAQFSYNGEIDVYNESPMLRLVSGESGNRSGTAVLEATAPGTTNVVISGSGEAWIGVVEPECLPLWAWVMFNSNSVPLSVTQGPTGAGITTGQAKSVTTNSAVLNSTSTITGSPQQVVVSYAYWETSNPAVVTTINGQTYSGVGNFYDEVLVTGLKANTQYTYHAIGRFMFEGTMTARDVTFTTLNGPQPCSPVTSTITVPFTFDGAGTFCWRTSGLGSYINTWNVDSLTINGIEFKNRYIAPPGPLPPAIDGFWYIGYRASVPWAHFEMK